ncbi:MAG: hypothetical protein ACFFBV_11235 [Promethearchaeota archaeon]
MGEHSATRLQKPSMPFVASHESCPHRVGPHGGCGTARAMTAQRG